MLPYLFFITSLAFVQPAVAQANRNMPSASLDWLAFLLPLILVLLFISLVMLIYYRCQLRKLEHRQARQTEKLRAFSVVLEQSPISILIADTQGKIKYANPYMCELSGYDEQELTRMHTRDLKSGLTPDHVYLELWQNLHNQKPWSGRFSSRNKQGEIYLEQVWMAPVIEENGQPCHYIAIKQDISEQERSLIRIKAHNKVLNRLNNNQPLKPVLQVLAQSLEQENPHWKPVFLCITPRGDALLWMTSHPLLQALLELPDSPLQGKHAFADNLDCHNFLERLDPNRRGQQLALQAGMQSCWLEPVLDAAGTQLGLILFFHQKKSPPGTQEQNLFAHAARLTRICLEHHQQQGMQRLAETVYRNSNEAMAVTDQAGNFIHVNPAFTRITGYQASEVTGRHIRMLTSDRHPAEFFQRLSARLQRHGRWQGEIWSRRKNGDIYPQYLSINSTHDAEGDVEFRVMLFADISKQKASEEEIWRLANYDSLTGLANRRNFMERFEHALSNARRNQQQLAVLFLDLDEFKPLNDTYGHAFGDKVLVEVAARMQQPLRETDLIARIGGDEFLILLDGNPDSENARQIARRIKDSVTLPFDIDGHQTGVSLSCGISLYPRHGDTADTLIRSADEAMYQAKEQGRNRIILASEPAPATPPKKT